MIRHHGNMGITLARAVHVDGYDHLPVIAQRVIPAYVSEAACGSTDPTIFYPEPGAQTNPIAKAKKVCADCPVSTECLQDALDRRDLQGVWGGKTANERRVLLGIPIKQKVRV